MSVDSVRRFVESRKTRSFFSQYILNPSLGASDLTFVAVAVTLFCCLRFAACGCLRFQRFSKGYSIINRAFKNIAKPRKELKFAENFWYFTWHTTSFSWGMCILYGEGLTAEDPGWIRMLLTTLDDKWYWHATPAEVAAGSPGWPELMVSPQVRFYYLSQLSFWLSCLAFVCLETIRKDFVAFTIHHLSTCILIAFSYVCSFWRLGVIIVIIHDSADIYLYCAKLLHYTRCPDRVVDLAFLGFVFAFCVSRLITFPFFCVLPFISPSKIVGWSDGLLRHHWDVPGGIVMPSFLVVLQILHVFWFGLILRMLARTIINAKGPVTVNQEGDIRSEDEGSVSALPNKKKQK